MDDKNVFEDPKQEEPVAHTEENLSAEPDPQPEALVHTEPAEVLNSDGGAVLPPKKSNKGLFLLGGIAAVVVAVIICVVAFGGFLVNPEKAVRKALDTTGSQLDVISKQMMEEIPAIKAMMPAEGAQSTNTQITIDSLTSDALPGVQGELISSVLKMFSLDMTTSTDNGIQELSGKVNMGGAPLVDLKLQLSPDDVAFHVPSFSETPLSLKFSTFVEDYKNSIFPEMDEETLGMLQSSLQAQAGSMNLLSGGFDPYVMQDELYAILNTALTNATYAKPVKEDALKVYTITLDGEQVKTTLVNLLQYIYVDSPIGALYAGQMKEMLQEQLIEPAKNLPAIPTTLVIKVDKSGSIAQLRFDIAPVTSENFVINAASMDYIISNQAANQVVNLKFDVTSDALTQVIDMDVTSDYKDGASTTALTMNFDMKDSMFSSYVGMTAEMMMDKAGAYNMSMDMAIGEEKGNTSMVDAGVDFKGTVNTVDSTTTFELPAINLQVDSQGQNMFTLVCGAKSETKPLATPIQPVFANAKPLFSMTEAELDAEMQKYYDGMNGVMQTVMGPFLSGMMG